MTLKELKDKIAEYQYMEDTRFIDAALACVIATRLKRGRPLWLILIGPSSSGKTQILRPLAMSDPKFIHSVDDLTENTLLSGARETKRGAPMSLLQRIGSLGMIIISDLTGIFSKQAESRSNILGQLRMIYDGEMVKYIGTSSKPLEWKGHLSILAGSTPTIYKHFEEVASLGERFLYYRLNDFDREKATHKMVERGNDTKIDEILSAYYGDYIKEVVMGVNTDREKLPENVLNRIVEVSNIVEMLRVSGEFDFRGENLVHIPIPAMPMRTAGQLMTLAEGLRIMKRHDQGNEAEIDEDDMRTIDWCGYSLINDKRRACLRILASIPYGMYLSTSRIGDLSGLPTPTVRMILQVFTAVKMVIRSGSGDGLNWSISDKKVFDFIRRVENIKTDSLIIDRKANTEEDGEIDIASDMAYELWGGEKSGDSV